MKILEMTKKSQEGTNIKKIKFLGIPIFKSKRSIIAIDRTKKKIFFLNIPIIKVFKNGSTKKIIFWKIPVFKKEQKNFRVKIYICGIRVIKTMSKNKEALKKLQFYRQIPETFSFKTEKNPVVSIIIPVFNQYEYTLKCLYSILKSEDETPYEIIIADDHSTDDTKTIEKKVSGITVIHNTQNLGYIKNVNNAAKSAIGKYVYFLNNDTIVQKKWLQALVKVLEDHPNIGVVGSKLIKPNGILQECGLFMFSDLFLTFKTNNSLAQENMYLKPCDYVSGCSLLTPKNLFEKIGGFDEIYAPAYCDDSDYCLSAKKLGFDTVVQPKSVIIHFGSVSYEKKSSDLIIRNDKLQREKWKSYFEKRTPKDPRKESSFLTRPASILVIDDLLPQFDKHAGGKTIFQFLQLFKKMNLNVKFCPLIGNQFEEPYYSILTDNGIEIIDNKYIYGWIEMHIGYLDYLLLSRPQIAECFLVKALRAKGVKVLYYGHDLHHLRMERENLYKTDMDNEAIQHMKIVEQSAIAFADMALYPSIVEKQYIQENFHLDNVEVITPYLYDTNQMPMHHSFSESHDILFVGSAHGPNLDGLLWFIEKIWPSVLEKIPDIHLNIVGSRISNKIKEIVSPNINIIGYLSEEKLNELYSHTKLSIAPLRYGAGIKGKIIDSLYHSTPVITTSIGIEGICNENDLIKYSDDEKEFAKKLITLYTNADEWNRLIPLYSPFIQKNYSFDAAEQTFRKFIDTTPKDNNERMG